jgi:hypothetical protein
MLEGCHEWQWRPGRDDRRLGGHAPAGGWRRWRVVAGAAAEVAASMTVIEVTGLANAAALAAVRHDVT